MSRARIKKKVLLRHCAKLGIPRWKVLTGHWFDGKKYFKECCGYVVGRMWDVARARKEIL
jgi:hypothetical protein